MASEDIQLHTRSLESSGSSYHQHSNSHDLLALLSNTLVLHQTVPYLPISSLLNLASASRSFRGLIHHSPGVFRHLDLTTVKRAQLCLDTAKPTSAQQTAVAGQHVHFAAEETEDDFYSGPLRGVLETVRRRDILQSVQTLVLDGLSVTAEFVNDLLLDESFNVRILSVRGCTNLNQAKLQQVLRFACRPGRTSSSKLQGLYVFGSDETQSGTASSGKSSRQGSVTSLSARGASSRSGSSSAADVISIAWNRKSQDTLDNAFFTNEGDDWYHKHGRIISKKIADGWAETMLDCRSSLRFDAVLCTGPRHQNSPAFGRVPVHSYASSGKATPWAVATFAVGGCAVCGTAPEGFTAHGESPEEHLPLLSPLLVHSSNVKTACRPAGASSESSGLFSSPRSSFSSYSSGGSGGNKPRFVPRCLECIRERYCFSCDQWWCESCYQVPGQHHIITGPASATTGQQQHVHAVDQPANFLAHELASIGSEQPGLKIRKIQKSCWDCDFNCDDCVTHTSRTCKSCKGEYCLLHYEGSTETHCDWCSSRRGGRRCN